MFPYQLQQKNIKPTNRKKIMTTENEEFEDYHLHREGQRALYFKGKTLVVKDTRDHNSTRWTKCAVYETDKGAFVVGLAHMTKWEGETDSYQAEVLKTLDEVVTFVEEWVPYLAPTIAAKLNVREEI